MSKVIVSKSELLETLQIIHVIRKVHAEHAEIDDAEYLGSIIWSLLDSFDEDGENCTVELDREQRFAVWLSLGQYRQFASECGHAGEYNRIVNIMMKFR